MKAYLQDYFNRWLDRRSPNVKQTTLTQRHIYIMPSRLGGYFLALLLLLLLVAINYQNNMIFLMVFLLASMFVVCVLHSYQNLSGLVIKQLYCRDAFINDWALLALQLKSDNTPHQSLRLCWGEPYDEAIFLQAGELKSLTLQFLPLERGYLQAPRLLIESFYPLGLLRTWTWLKVDSDAYVYPEPVYQPFSQHFGKGSDSDVGEQLTYDGEDFYGFSQYQQGDSLRRVNWSSYAKGGSLMTKQFSQSNSTIIQLDYDDFSGGVEQRLSALCYWIVRFTENDQSFSVNLAGQLYGPDQGLVYQTQLLQVLAVFSLPGSSKKEL